MPGVRGRLAIVLVALVALTAGVLGIGSYLFVDATLHQRILDDTVVQARFDLSVVAPSRLATGASRADVLASGLLETFRLRGDVDAVIDLGDGDPLVSASDLSGLVATLPADVRALVDRGQIGYAWLSLPRGPVLVVGGRVPPRGPAIWFVRSTAELDGTLGQLRLALGVGAALLALVALLAGRRIARGVLAPVEAAGRAAERMEAGDLAARIPVTSRDEFGAWAERFNRMAATLEETVGRLRAAQAQNRRFVADVSHELRTPLAALVAEASVLRGHLDGLPGDARRAAELLVTDVARLRVLVEDLMELSRFDAAVEQVREDQIDLGEFVAATVAAHLPAATLELPGRPVVISAERRRLDRILGNLLDNARQHAPGAAVVVRVIEGEDTVDLVVADRGPGIPDADTDRIFERFTTADPSRHGGSGLGLAIAREHAELLGGSLVARTRAGGGLAIRLRLPVTRPLPDGDRAATGGTEDGATGPSAQEPT